VAEERPEKGSAVRSVLADVRTSLTALGSSFRSPDIAKALAAYLAFTITEWAAFIALIVYASLVGTTPLLAMVGRPIRRADR
jgi:hypothetical protein